MTATSVHGSDRLSARARTRLGTIVIAELAVGIADQIVHVRVIVVAKCLSLLACVWD